MSFEQKLEKSLILVRMYKKIWINCQTVVIYPTNLANMLRKVEKNSLLSNKLSMDISTVYTDGFNLKCG